MLNIRRDRLNLDIFNNQFTHLISCEESISTDLNTIKKSVPSIYADPASWLVLDALEKAIKTCNIDIEKDRIEVGVIAISAQCTKHTMHRITNQVKGGRISPIRFAGANPGSLAGLPCIIYGFKGPSLTFSMLPNDCLETVNTLSISWFRQKIIRFLIVNCYEIDDCNNHIATSFIIQGLK